MADDSNNMEERPGYEKLLAQDLAYQLGAQIPGSSNLFHGIFNNKIPIALKRYKAKDNDSKEYQRNLELLSSPENRHPNLIRYFGHAVKMVGDKPKFNFLAVEWCECSVADIIKPKNKHPIKISTDRAITILNSISHKEILRQSSEAVNFLHGLDIIHRKIHPDNFLISCVDPNKEQFLIKLTDFQQSKKIEEINTPIKPKNIWVAPESFRAEKLTNKMDSFLMGCYYYYVLSKGNHPFLGRVINASEQEILNNIRNKGCETYQSDWKGGFNWKTAFPLSTSHKEEASWALNMIKDLIKFEPLNRKSVEDVLLKNKYFQPESYKIYDHPKAKIPGLCIIITQAQYHNPQQNLCLKDSSGKISGCVEVDADNLYRTFSSFGYDILSLKNLRADEIVKFLSPNELSKMLPTKDKRHRPSFKDYASLIVCFLGHGDQGVVIGVDDGRVSLNSIQYDAFDDIKCPDLRGKPKVFIILACQGGKSMKAIKRKYDEMSVPSLMPGTTSISNVKNEECSPPVFDFIRLMATIEGYVAYCDSNTGSPFINSLCKALDHEYNEVNQIDPKTEKEKYKREEKKIVKKSLGKRDLTQLFTTFVTPLVGRTRQTPEFRSSLSKTIRFRRIHNPVLIPPEPFYDGANQIHFKHARAYYESLGYKE